MVKKVKCNPNSYNSMHRKGDSLKINYILLVNCCGKKQLIYEKVNIPCIIVDNKTMNSRFTVIVRFSVQAKKYEVVDSCIVIFTKNFVGWQELCIMYMHQNMTY